MNWVPEQALAALRSGQNVILRPFGSSMEPLVMSGQECVIEPIGEQLPEMGEIVLCRVNGRQYLHLVKQAVGARFLIGNNKGGINGWIGIRHVYGRLVRSLE